MSGSSFEFMIFKIVHGAGRRHWTGLAVQRVVAEKSASDTQRLRGVGADSPERGNLSGGVKYVLGLIEILNKALSDLGYSETLVWQKNKNAEGAGSYSVNEAAKIGKTI